MKILFISMSPIQKGVSIGNTFLNVFEDFPDVQFFSVYTKNGYPDSSIERAFQITDKQLLKRLLHRTKTVGRTVPERDGQENAPAEDKMVTFARKKRYIPMFWAQSLLWLPPYWKSEALHTFLDEVQPDLLFTILSDSVPLNKLIWHIQGYLQKPLVVYAWDNNYTLQLGLTSPLVFLNRCINRHYMRKTVQKAEQLYVISEIQKQDYEKAFGVSCKILTKSADFSGEPPVKTQYNSPLQLVFTGNIGTNRWKSLAIIAEALEQINQNGVRAQLRIYTATPLTAKMEKALKKGDSSFIMGSVPANEVPKIQEAADILVHVEALDLKNRLAVRQSFSTKLVDYFKAARPILAVGPREVASIDHLIRNDCALNGETVEEVRSALESVLENRGKLDELSKKAYACGKRNHNAELMHHMLQTDLETIARRVEFEDFADKRSQ